jgi:hypothetical protein
MSLNRAAALQAGIARAVEYREAILATPQPELFELPDLSLG